MAESKWQNSAGMTVVVSPALTAAGRRSQCRAGRAVLTADRTVLTAGRAATDDATKAKVAGSAVDRFALSRRWPVAQAVIRRAQMRAALDDLARKVRSWPCGDPASCC